MNAFPKAFLLIAVSPSLAAEGERGKVHPGPEGLVEERAGHSIAGAGAADMCLAVGNCVILKYH